MRKPCLFVLYKKIYLLFSFLFSFFRQQEAQKRDGIFRHMREKNADLSGEVETQKLLRSNLGFVNRAVLN